MSRKILWEMDPTDTKIKFYSSPPGQNGRHFDIIRPVFTNEIFFYFVQNFTVPKGPIDNNPALV